jgi:hypothetical protein
MKEPSIIELPFHILEEKHRFEDDLVFDHASARQDQIERPIHFKVDSEEVNAFHGGG